MADQLPAHRPPTHVDTTADVLPDVPMLRETLAATAYAGVSGLADVLAGKGLLEKALAVLAEPIDEQHLAIKPTGEIYLPQTFYRRILNRAFPLAWGMRPLKGYELPKVIQSTGNTEKVVWPMELVVHGMSVAVGVGQGSWSKNNPRGSLGDAAESAKSDAIVRACKDLGIAGQCWDPVFAATWVKANCVRVRVKTYDGKIDVQWRRRDGEPLRGEIALAPEGERPPPETLQKPASTDDFLGDAPKGREPGSDDGDPTPTGPITQTDIRRLMAVCHEFGVDEDALKAHLATAYHCKSRKQFPARHFEALLAWVRIQGGTTA